ncbi:hypothetical protein E8E14_003829 [Neopestalotiopsis sp. 37M]|nr:hypothetical protein E8E14_003829 [Neopestalotiopsis sp. 37M]
MSIQTISDLHLETPKAYDVHEIPAKAPYLALLGDIGLFSHVPQENHESVKFGLNDFFHTGGWDVDAHNERHRRDLEWLNTEVAALEHSDVDIIILRTGAPRGIAVP